MAENSGIKGEYQRLTTNTNVSLVDENLYLRTLRNKNIPYDIRHRQFDKQNSKTEKPHIPPGYSSLNKISKINTADLSAQLPSSRNKFLTPDNAFRQRSPPTPNVRQNQINFTQEYVDTDKTCERFSLTHRQGPNNTSSKTLF